MKRNKDHSKYVDKISRRDNLPLLRGMFVSPESSKRAQMLRQRNACHSCTSDEGLFLSAEEGLYLGG